MTINNEKVAPLTHNYLPQHLKVKPLYYEINELLDYLIKKCYEPHIINMRDKFNPLGTGFDTDEFLHLIDGFKYKDKIFKNVDVRTVCTLLPRIYTLKGTKKGLQMILNILGIHADIHIWWEILRKLGKDPIYTENFRLKFGDIKPQEIEECSIYLNLISDSGSTLVSVLDAEIDAKLKELCTSFLWVCASINVINLLRQFSDPLSINDELKHTGEQSWTSTNYNSFYIRTQGTYNDSNDVIYDSTHIHNEPGLKYNYGNSSLVKDLSGYHEHPETEWTFAGSLFKATEEFSFSDKLPTIRSSLIRIDDSSSHLTENYLNTNIEINSTFDDLSTLYVYIKDTLTIRDKLFTNIGQLIENYATDEDKPFHNSKYTYIDDTGNLKYASPLKENFTLSDSLAYLIEEDN